jgi:hypothetical protein
MVVENINLKKDLLNGTMAKVFVVNLCANNEIKSIKITLIDHGLQTTFKISTIHYKYFFQGKFFKAKFPLALRYTMTWPQSQRATIYSKIKVNIHNSFTLRLTYIMLSRVTKMHHLFITHRLSPNNFYLV